MYDFEKPVNIKAINVVKPPFNTAGPIKTRAPAAFSICEPTLKIRIVLLALTKYLSE